MRLGRLLALAFLALYLSLPTATYTYDAVAYVSLIHRAAFLGFSTTPWNEFHILYIPSGWLLETALLKLGLTPDVLSVMQAACAACAALAVGVCFGLIRSQTQDDLLAAAAAAFLGLSYSFWHFATNPEVYAPCVLLLLLAAAQALAAGRGGSVGRSSAAGALHGLAAGFHVASILLAPALMAALLPRGRAGERGGDPPRGRWRGIAAYLGTFLTVALAPYLVRYEIVGGVSTASGFSRLLARAAEQEDPSGRPWLLGRGYDLAGEVSGFLAGILPDGAGSSSARSALRAWARILGAAAAAALLASRAGALWRSRRVVTAVSLAWFGAFFLFFAAYNPGSLKFVSFLLVPILLLVAAGIATFDAGDWRRRLPTAALGAAALLMGAVNLTGSILPESDPRNNRDLAESLFVKEHTRAGDLVLHAGMGEHVLQKVYLPYFAGREEIVLDLRLRFGGGSPEAALARVEEEIRGRAARGGRVFVFRDLVEDGVLRGRLEEEHGLPPGALGAFLARWDARPWAALDGRFGLVLLDGS